jgi:hypothetical protein
VVDDDAVLGQVGQGFAYAQARLEPARLSHCMRFIGRASRAMEIAQQYAAQRESFGQRLADLQQVQAMVADSHIDLHASRLMVRDCARKMDAGESVKHDSAMTKIFVSEAVWRVADRAVQIMGALGISDDTPVSMIQRDYARSASTTARPNCIVPRWHVASSSTGCARESAVNRKQSHESRSRTTRWPAGRGAHPRHGHRHRRAVLSTLCGHERRRRQAELPDGSDRCAGWRQSRAIWRCTGR